MAAPTTEIIVQRDVEVPLRDGTVLRADLYRPAADGRFPTLVQRTPYGKDFNPGIWVVLDPVKAACAGFAVVVQDVRGRGRSDGDFYPFTNEARDGVDTIAWTAEQEWCDGNIGMYGSSYMAASQWQAAKESPAALRAIAPFQASSDYCEGRSYRGGAFEVGALLGVALNALGGGIAHRMIKRGTLPRSAAAEARAAIDDLGSWSRTEPLTKLRSTVLGDIAPFFFDWAEHPDPAHPYWERLTVEGRYRDVALPVLHLSSWYDQAHVGTLRNFEGMTAEAPADVRDRQFLLMGPWAHRVPRGTTLGQLRVGDLYMGAGAIFDMDALQLKWFKKVLAGEPAAWPHPERVRLFVMGANEWRNYPSWPPTQATPRALHLVGDDGGDGDGDGDDGRSAAGSGRLAWEPAASSTADVFAHDPDDPVPTRGGAHMAPEAVCPAGPVEQASVQERADVLVYTGEPLEEDLEVIGWVEARMWVGCDADADYAVTLCDVWPDGSAYNVCDGYLRVPAGSVREDEPVTVRLGATAQVFRAGHRVRVHVAGSSSPRHPVAGAGGAGHRQLVRSGGATLSAVLLPVMPSEPARS